MLQYIHFLNFEINMYKLFFYLALASVPILLFATRKHYGYSIRRTAFYTSFTLCFGLVSAVLTAWLKKIMLSLADGAPYHDAERLRNYGIPIFLPVFLLLYCNIFKDDFKKLSDYIAPCVYSVMTFVKIGCVFWGCCYGKPDENGLWNAKLGYRTFPVQLYDSVTSLIIVMICLLLLWRMKKKHFGFIYPIGGILFAITKGYWESFRVHESANEQSYYGTGWTLWQYWLLVLFVECAVWLISILLHLKKNKRR